MKNVFDAPHHLRKIPEGLTQTRYSKFKGAPESRIRTAFDRVTERVTKSSTDWRKTCFWEGDLND